MVRAEAIRSLMVLESELKKFKINPQDLTKEQLMNQLMDRYELQLQILHANSDILRERRCSDLTILREERAMLKRFSKATIREGNRYNHYMATNPDFQDDFGVMPVALAIEMKEKLTCFDLYAAEFDEKAKSRTDKIKEPKVRGR